MTKHKIAHFLKGKIRDKVKQVILIDGIPEILHTVREMKTTIVIFNNKKYRLDIPFELIDEFKKLSTIKIEESIRRSKKFKPILIPGLGHRTSIRAVNGNTHITVGGSDEAQLAERIELIKEYLTSLGIKSIERCYWTCSTDKAKPDTDYQYPHKQSEPVNNNPYSDNPLQTWKQPKPAKPVMSEKTKSLREIALIAIKESEAKT